MTGCRRRTPVRVAVVGLGYWGPHPARNLFELEEAELAGVCDVRDDARQALARRYPGVPTFATTDELFERADIDAVAIATPVSTHHALGSKALESGKHVFMEKPMARTAAQAEDLIRRAG